MDLAPLHPIARAPWRGARLAAVGLTGAMVATLLAAGVATAVVPTTLYVSPTGSDSNACSEAMPCQTISHAVGVAVPGSTINVEAGTYHESVVIGKQLTLTGHDAVIDATGLMADLGAGPLHDQGIIGWAVLIVGPGAAGTTFQGFTVQHAAAEGILAVMTSDVTIQHNELRGNDTAATATNPAPFECQEQGNVPGDCGEALHLLSVTDSNVLGNNVHDNVGGILLTDEIGPTSGNTVAWNVSKHNRLDCGITLPSHNPMATTDPSLGGVYDNLITHNVSEGNGGAGVGMFAPFPGTASYDNHVTDNVLRNNGEAGVGIHSHAPGQNVSGNVITDNTISGNRIDPDSGSPAKKNGIVIWSAADAVSVTVARNRIVNEDIGIYEGGAITADGISTNRISPSVKQPIVQVP